MAVCLPAEILEKRVVVFEVLGWLLAWRFPHRRLVPLAAAVVARVVLDGIDDEVETDRGPGDPVALARFFVAHHPVVTVVVCRIREWASRKFPALVMMMRVVVRPTEIVQMKEVALEFRRA